jgi:hypothetical protein
LRALHLYQSWCEDGAEPYSKKAMQLYNFLEGTLVNQELPKGFTRQAASLMNIEKGLEKLSTKQLVHA